MAPFQNANIYSAGTVRTTIVGFSRVAAIALLLAGSFSILPNALFDPTISWWWSPLVVLGSATPLIITTLATAPFVSNARIVLPSHVKRTALDVERYVRNLPPDTKIVLQTMRFVPWPMHREVHFSQLRRLPDGKGIGANLEALPSSTKLARATPSSKPTMNWFAKRLYQTYFIDPSQIVDRSALPGLMGIIWNQIPIAKPSGIVESAAPVTEPRHTTNPSMRQKHARDVRPKTRAR